MTGRLVLVRHGESTWNKENRFTGWTDVDLSEKGVEEARASGRQMFHDGYLFDVAYTSVLKRAIRTLWLALDEMDLMWIPVFKTWRLNERHYGALQGLNKLETVERHGEEQVKIWRRSYDIRPPALDADDPRAPHHDPTRRSSLPAPSARPAPAAPRPAQTRLASPARDATSATGDAPRGQPPGAAQPPGQAHRLCDPAAGHHRSLYRSSPWRITGPALEECRLGRQGDQDSAGS